MSIIKDIRYRARLYNLVLAELANLRSMLLAMLTMKISKHVSGSVPIVNGATLGSPSGCQSSAMIKLKNVIIINSKYRITCLALI